MILAEKIMKLRKQQGWSQEELAVQLHVSRQSVSKWESGASIPDLDKILQLGELFGVSTDFLLKDEREDFPTVNIEDREGVATDAADGEAWRSSGRSWEAEPEYREVTVEEADTYMKLVSEAAFRIAAAVSACVLSPVLLIVLAAMTEFGKLELSEDAAGGIGMIALLLFVAGAVAVFICDGMKLKKYSYLEEEPLKLQYGIAGIVEQKKEQFEPQKTKCITIGVMLCILGVVPLFVAGVMSDSDFAATMGAAVLLVMVAIAVFLFVSVGMIAGSYDKLLEEGDYTKEKKEQNKNNAPIAAIYWCLVTAGYLAASFVTNRWDMTWIVWPVAGVLYGALAGILEIRRRV